MPAMPKTAPITSAPTTAETILPAMLSPSATWKLPALSPLVVRTRYTPARGGVTVACAEPVLPAEYVSEPP
jgi:hypothetical protein